MEEQCAKRKEAQGERLWNFPKFRRRRSVCVFCISFFHGGRSQMIAGQVAMIGRKSRRAMSKIT